MALTTPTAERDAGESSLRTWQQLVWRKSTRDDNERRTRWVTPRIARIVRRASVRPARERARSGACLATALAATGRVASPARGTGRKGATGDAHHRDARTGESGHHHSPRPNWPGH